MAVDQPKTDVDVSARSALDALAALNGELLDSPWSVRSACGTRGRPALEVYNSGLLLDVLVAKPFTSCLLRGARRGEREGRESVLAWGYLPPDGLPPQVVFSRRYREPRAAEAVGAVGTFWIALVQGRYDRVAATGPGGASAQLRVRAGWSR